MVTDSQENIEIPSNEQKIHLMGYSRVRLHIGFAVMKDRVAYDELCCTAFESSNLSFSVLVFQFFKLSATF
ncbi:hypothetical protein [Candidatus Lokiarchaeum ossiferum]|uniref:hypothetical protein n=1 Tax=Candidatus Lokiarchaeum ossiferum TaxID=2951803 RepID=UPI00352BE7B9